MPCGPGARNQSFDSVSIVAKERECPRAAVTLNS